MEILDVKSGEIYTNILVYKNPFKNLDNVLNVIKESESQESKFYIQKWTKWGPFGTMAKANLPSYITDEDAKIDIGVEKQKEVLEEIERIYDFVGHDYMLRFGENVTWPKFVTTTDLNNKKWHKGSVDILKHDIDPTKKLAMQYHTDQNWHKLDARGDKFGLTITMYLNDDYEGGEISFAHIGDYGDIKLTTYKPQAGDVVVFPGFYPYFHGVLGVKDNYKYMVRMFYFWEFEGTEEWLANESKYGTELWNQMEEKRIQDIYEEYTKQDFYNVTNPENYTNIDPNSLFVPDNLPESNNIYIKGKYFLSEEA